MSSYNVGVVIGRFQPLHNAHVELLKFALENFDYVVIAIGSALSARTIKNPFTYLERKYVIEETFIAYKGRFDIVPIRDYPHDDSAWVANVKTQVTKDLLEDSKCTLIGVDKDESTFYLKLFPDWGFLEMSKSEGPVLNATDIRKQLFANSNADSDNVPYESTALMRRFQKTLDFENLQEEYNASLIRTFICRVKDGEFHSTKRPVISQCADCIVIHRDYILLVRRKNLPGKGLLALPGGHVEMNETIQQGALRELDEETTLRIEGKKAGSNLIVKQQVFDSPKRSSIGRKITTAFVLNIPSDNKVTVFANDDAEEMFWIPLEDFRSGIIQEIMFEDHFFIVETMLFIKGTL